MSEHTKKASIAYLHHSTGNCVWKGGVPEWFERYNREHDADLAIEQIAFPKKEPYGWRNYPYDYWNIWVNHAGGEAFMGEPTLEMLTARYDVIVLKHCFPVSDIKADEEGRSSVDDETKTLANYRLQYAALADAFTKRFPDTRFVVWTCAALTEAVTDAEAAGRAAEFSRWVRDEWSADLPNVSVWDFFNLETGGGLVLKPEFANGEKDPHPNEAFCKMAAPQICEAIVAALG